MIYIFGAHHVNAPIFPCMAIHLTVEVCPMSTCLHQPVSASQTWPGRMRRQLKSRQPHVYPNAYASYEYLELCSNILSLLKIARWWPLGRLVVYTCTTGVATISKAPFALIPALTLRKKSALQCSIVNRLPKWRGTCNGLHKRKKLSCYRLAVAIPP